MSSILAQRRQRQRTADLPPSRDLDKAASVLSRHANNPSAFLALNDRTRHFSVPGVDGLIAYRPCGRRHVVQLGGVFAAPDDQWPLLDSFRRFAASSGRKVIAVQLLPEDARLYAAAGLTVNQFGSDYARRLPTFELAGRKYVQLRNKISRARRAGVVVSEVEAGAPRRELDPQLSVIDASWLRSKGRHIRELAFMVGERGGGADGHRRLFVATDEAGEPIAYVSFSPVYGRHGGWLHDLSRRRPDATPGSLELVVATAVERFRSEGAHYLHFGFTPFTGLAEEHEQAGFGRMTGRLIRFLAAHGSALYPASDQVAYKLKWGPDLVQPEYVAVQGRLGPAAVVSLLRVLNVA